MEKYIILGWPEIQKFVEHPRWNECRALISDSAEHAIPEDLYKEVTYKLQFPKKYENTNLGTIVCYETRAIVNGTETFWYDENTVQKGNIALIYDENGNWHTSKIVACSKGFPIILEDSEFIIGINCDFIGHYNLE